MIPELEAMFTSWDVYAGSDRPGHHPPSPWGKWEETGFAGPWDITESKLSIPATKGTSGPPFAKGGGEV